MIKCQNCGSERIGLICGGIGHLDRKAETFNQYNCLDCHKTWSIDTTNDDNATEYSTLAKDWIKNKISDKTI